MFHIRHYNSGRTLTLLKTWRSQSKTNRADTTYREGPVHGWGYTGCWWTSIWAALPNYCTVIYQDGICTVHTQCGLRRSKMQYCAVTVDNNVTREGIHFEDGKTIWLQNQSDERWASRLLYLQIMKLNSYIQAYSNYICFPNLLNSQGLKARSSKRWLEIFFWFPGTKNLVWYLGNVP